MVVLKVSRLLSKRNCLVLKNNYKEKCSSKYLPGAFIGQDIVLHACLVTGLSSSVHRVLGCWYSSIHLISLVLYPVSHDFEHCKNSLYLNINNTCSFSLGIVFFQIEVLGQTMKEQPDILSNDDPQLDTKSKTVTATFV